MPVTCLDDKWDAWYNKQPGAEDDRLHVAGKVGCSSSSIELTLLPTNEGVVDDPDLFVLRLDATEPEVGDDLYDEKDVDWADPVDREIKRVEIRGVCQATIKVRIVE